MIKNKYYHIECQSNPDSTMEVRMIEYDFMIAHEHARKEKGTYVINFPESAVLFLILQIKMRAHIPETP